MAMVETSALTACPHQQDMDDRKTAQVAGDKPGPAIRRGEDGTVHIRSFALARQILRGGGTRQAGFKAEEVTILRDGKVVPVLYQGGAVHQKQRAATARFFTPKAVNTRYRDLMVTQSDALIARLVQSGRADLDKLSMELAVAVAAEIIGLTESNLADMSNRLDRFFATPQSRGKVMQFITMLLNRWYLLQFYRADVRPAIRARKASPREDVISHLLSQNYLDHQILTECITYGAAGMVTTREFIVVAAWHLIDRPELRDRFLAADEDMKIRMLEEILRLEPVVGIIYRRTQANLCLDNAGREEKIAARTLVAINVRGVNTDPAMTGECPYRLEPDREIRDGKGGGALMSFGDGAHRCPGATVALQESAIFLDRLLRIPGLRLERAPDIAWSPVVAGYELRGATIATI